MPIRKSRISRGVTSGTTADRPSNPSIGDTFFNGTLGVQEIYTDSGWLPATGANDFNVVLTGSETSVTLDKEYFSGAYTISSSLNDTSFDLYLFDTQNNPAGYTSTPSINATSNFNKVVVYGGTSGDLLSFAYKTTFTTATSNTDTFAAPYISSIDNFILQNVDDTFTITGGNFDTDVQVWFDGQNSYSEQAKSVVYGSPTSIVATRPDSLNSNDEPYTVRVVNPGIVSPESSNAHKTANSFYAGSAPIWNTEAGLLPFASVGIQYSTFLSATDPDGQAINYYIESGELIPGLTLNSSTGEISGTTSSESSATLVIAATDSAGRSTNRSFILATSLATGGSITNTGGYQIHKFESSGTFNLLAPSEVEYLVVGGGGGGGWDVGGGGGAGGFLQGSVTLQPANYSVAIGAGGVGSTTNNNQASNGENSSFSNIVALGGGYGGNWNGTDASYRPGGNGGSGGGGGGWSQSQASATGGSGTPGQGNNGGYGGGGSGWTGGGGGGAGGAGSNSISSTGGSVSGGAGISSSASGPSVTYAQGGRGMGDSTGGAANGAQATGNGADGGGSGNTGQNGGSGIVIIRYPI